MHAAIARMIAEEKIHINTKMSELLHDYAQNGTLTEKRVRQIITGEKTGKPRSKRLKPIELKAEFAARYFLEEQSQEEIENTIVNALEKYFAYMKRGNINE